MRRRLRSRRAHAEGSTSGTSFPSATPPPEDAIQFTRDVWMQTPPRQVQVYVTEKARWEHLDGSPCPAGLNVPLSEWAQVSIPLLCADDRQIRLRDGGPFWLDEVPVIESTPALCSPRSDQPGRGIAPHSGSGLCDGQPPDGVASLET